MFVLSQLSLCFWGLNIPVVPYTCCRTCLSLSPFNVSTCRSHLSSDNHIRTCGWISVSFLHHHHHHPREPSSKFCQNATPLSFLHLRCKQSMHACSRTHVDGFLQPGNAGCISKHACILLIIHPKSTCTFFLANNNKCC
ncbi:uncharacterized protein LY89DRAFT_373828 [Mollisia scopiformis]|uniref:Secreted protein n=1 Tax=Mollisia scopiformis TaxID=149040 RepID=A0A132B3Q9_MOLSC|nr:uncharacterized protein LY89DRAFT_373828 [Mollisia scopiformis]KUJ06961.1 hypothetical protein LY89DRAFT_373828 [Mollisia scopiformis]